MVSEPMLDVDVLHTISDHDNDLVREWQALGKPWVTTCHLDPRSRGKERAPATENWIFVSRTLAQLYDSNRYVLNGVDPAEYIFSESKENYILFMSTMDWGNAKGLDVVLSLAGKQPFKVVVAGTGNDWDSVNRVTELCRKANAIYVGDVRGKTKAKLLAGARALLFPTKLDEAFGLDVGFVCRDQSDYLAAINNVAGISPQACRDRAISNYHYLRMAADYAVEYERELTRNGN
jgi:glycosyltransferase involved in cell wall biosynthesis